MKRNKVLAAFALSIIRLGICSKANASMVTNGDFGNGNNDFSTAYTFYDITSKLNMGEGQYCITTDPKLCHGYATSYGDHSSGSGYMMGGQRIP